jgi:hypothetical protein
MTRAESEPRTLNTRHLFAPPPSREAWEARARRLREQILFSAGLWPMPKKIALAPRVTGRVEGADYTVENVALRTLPGFYLCGNLYRPRGKKGPFPAIVNPHGHWKNGRLEMEADVPRAEAPPAPPAPGKGNLVAIGVNLARMGFVTFAYDMIGYNDTRQVTHEFAKDLRPWLHAISLLGLQLWNSIRVVDYLESLPDVDRARIGATGASGGGTQTFLLCAVDDRIRAAVPVNMISAQMQGGCLCENGPGLRLGTDNVEIGAMMAPKPLLLVACTGDWTKNNPTEEWPVLRKVYDLYGAGDRTSVVQFNYEHNYNVESREAMYAWFGRWLLNDADASHFREHPFDLDAQRLRVWTEANPMPAVALPEAALTEAVIAAGEKQQAALRPRDAAGLERFRQVFAPALRNSLGVEVPDRPARGRKPGRAALIVTTGAEGEGAAEARESATAPHFLAARLTEALQGRNCEVGRLTLSPAALSREQLWSDFFTCYNRTPLGEAVQQIVTALAELEAEREGPVDVVGLGEAGLRVLLARALCPGAGRTLVDAGRFRSTEDAAYLNGLYAPGLRRAGDFRTAALLVAPAPLCLVNTGDAFDTATIAAGFRAAGASLRIERDPLAADAIAGWLDDKHSTEDAKGRS